MNKTVMMSVFGAAAVALLGLCWVQHQEIQKLKAGRESLTAEVKALTARKSTLEQAVARENKAKSKGAVVAAKSGKESSESQAMLTAAAETKPVEARARPEEAKEAPMAGLAQMMKNPGMRDMIRAQQKGQQDMMYGSLFKCLQLPEADMESFKSLLLDRQMALVDSSMDMMSGEATPEEKKAAAEKMKETTAAYDAQIKALLGDDNYTLYKSFEETQAERMQVTMFKGSLAAGDQLTDEQEDSLIRSMHEARNNFKFSVPELADQKAADPSMFTPERITKMLEDSAKLQEQYVAEAAKVLSPAQLELFKANQKQQQAMQEMGMRMAAKMFGQPAKAEAAKGQ
jgi:hypothetical protein